MPPSRKSDIAKRSPGSFATYRALTAQTISKGEAVRVVSSNDGYFSVVKALGDGSQSGKLMVATIDSDSKGILLVADSEQVTLDTSAGALGDTVYVSSSVAGELTLTPTLVPVGWVSEVGTSGKALLDPAASEAATGGNTSPVTLLTASGGQVGYSTIQAAMNDAGASETVLVYPGTYAENLDFTGLAAGVRVTGFPNAQNVIISGADATSTRVTLPQTGTLREVTVVAPSSGANPAIDCTGLGAGNLGVLVNAVVQGAGGSGPLVKGAGSGLLVALQGLFHNGGATTGAFIEVTGGTAILQNVIANVGAVSDILKVSAGDVTCQDWVVQTSALYTATDGVDISGGRVLLSDVIFPGKTNSGVTNAFHVSGDGVYLECVSGRVESAAGGLDLLVDPALVGTGSEVGLLTKLDFDKVTVPSGYRDVAETRFNFGTATGWANYADTTHTSGSPQALTASTRTQWTNDGGTELVDYRPGKAQLWDSDKIQAVQTGEAYLVRITFTIDPATTNGIVDIDIDIGSDPFGASSIIILTDTFPLPKGNAIASITRTYSVYCLDSFVANGGAIGITSSVNADIYDKNILITRIH